MCKHQQKKTVLYNKKMSVRTLQNEEDWNEREGKVADTSTKVKVAQKLNGQYTRKLRPTMNIVTKEPYGIGSKILLYLRKHVQKFRERQGIDPKA